MIVNTEWGAFGDNGELDFIKTQWDRAVDENSLNPGKQIFEKMISGNLKSLAHFVNLDEIAIVPSGMYMGELIRQVLLDLMKDDLIFVGVNRDPLMESNSFFTRFASEIESDAIGDYTRCRQALDEMGMDQEIITDEDCSTLRLAILLKVCLYLVLEIIIIDVFPPLPDMFARLCYGGRACWRVLASLLCSRKWTTKMS